MTYKEIYFQITPTKEIELFKYITETCHCKILSPIIHNSNEATFKEDISADSPLYVIVDGNVEVEYKLDVSTQSEIRYILEIPIGLPYISYERFDVSDNSESINRLFITYDFFKPQNCLLNKYKMMQKWIKSHAQKNVRLGRQKIYLVEGIS